MSTQLHETIAELEKELHQPDTRKSKERLHTLLADSFVEFGQSGNVYNKKDIIEHLLESPTVTFHASNFAVKELSSEIVLITYRTEKDNMRSLRSSIWQKIDDNWQMIFHQGTPTK